MKLEDMKPGDKIKGVAYTGGSRTKADPFLGQFLRYCMEHPDERFWQALRNWSQFKAIYGMTVGAPTDLELSEESRSKVIIHDTFYQE